jgi:hypothetical protein
VSSLVAIMFTLWGMAETVIFDGHPVNVKYVWIGIPFYVPFFLWLRVLFCPGTREYNFRQYVMEKRFWRQKVSKTRHKVYLGHDKWDEEDRLEEERQAKARELRELQRQEDIALKMKIGKNVPKLGEVSPKVYQNHRHQPNAGLNVVIDRRGQMIVKPPEILPTMVLKTGTAHKLPNYSKNRCNYYKFQHPDPEGEEVGFEVQRIIASSSEGNRQELNVDSYMTTPTKSNKFDARKKDRDRSVRFEVV